MPLYVTFHLRVCCFPKYMCTCFLLSRMKMVDYRESPTFVLSIVTVDIIHLVIEGFYEAALIECCHIRYNSAILS